MQRIVDYAPLLNPIDPAALRQFKADWKLHHPYAFKASHAIVVVVALAFVMFLATAVIVLIGGTLAIAVTGPSDPWLLLRLGGPFVVFAIVVFLVVRGLIQPGRWQRRFKLAGFAAANGMVYRAASANPQYPGAIFGLGSSRKSLDHLSSVEGRYLDYGNYTYTTGSGRSRRTHTWGFLALHLDRNLPHMVLDAKANDGLLGTSLPRQFARAQRLSLEGDFDRHFTLYCPQEYERDALYVFTPDLMALLIDEAAPFDVEIVDRWMLVYSPKRFDMTQPGLHQRILHIVDTVGAKALSRTDRYRDERIGDFSANIVADPGRRLRHGLPVVAIVGVTAALAFWGLPILLRLIG